MNVAQSLRFVRPIHAEEKFSPASPGSDTGKLELAATELSDAEARHFASGRPLDDHELYSTFLRVGDRPGYRRS
jgi:hypothetical protein